jgi:hypothetical protein
MLLVANNEYAQAHNRIRIAGLPELCTLHQVEISPVFPFNIDIANKKHGHVTYKPK